MRPKRKTPHSVYDLKSPLGMDNEVSLQSIDARGWRTDKGNHPSKL